MGEVFFIIGLIGFLVLPFLFMTGKGRILWLITMSTIGAIVGIMEIIGKFGTGHTISQYFWIWSENHPMTAVIVLCLLLVGWLNLLIHLGWRLIRKYIIKK